MPKISIVIPMFNAEAFIDKCFNSILVQEFQDFEVIAVDDGSKDTTFKKAQSYAQKDKRFTVVHQANGGHTSARKLGCTCATGEYIKTIDVDDTLLPTTLSDLIYLAEKHSLDIVQCSHNVIHVDGSTTLGDIGFEGIIDSKHFIHKLLLQQGVGGPNVSLFKRELLTEDTFSLAKDVKVYEELIMMLTLALRANRIGIFREYVVYNYFLHKQSLTHNYKLDSSLGFQSILSKIADLLKQHQLQEEYTVEMQTLALGFAFDCCLHNKLLYKDAWVRETLKRGKMIKLPFLKKVLYCWFRLPYGIYSILFNLNQFRRKVFHIT